MSLNGWPLKLCSWWNEIWNRSIKLRPRTVPFSVSADAILFSFFFRLPSRANCCHRLVFLRSIRFTGIDCTVPLRVPLSTRRTQFSCFIFWSFFYFVSRVAALRSLSNRIRWLERKINRNAVLFIGKQKCTGPVFVVSSLRTLLPSFTGFLLGPTCSCFIVSRGSIQFYSVWDTFMELIISLLSWYGIT